MSWICPECREPARKVPPRVDITPQLREWGIPAWSHNDSTPLCPVITRRGYEPAQPQQVPPTTEQETRSLMSKAHTYLATAVDALASEMTDKQDWPADLGESAPQWGELMKQLGEVARWVMQGAVIVRDDAEELPPTEGRPLAIKAGELVSVLNVATSSRAEVDHRWRAISTTLAREPVPGTGHGRPTLVTGVVHEAAQAVRKAASQRLAAGDVVAVLEAAGAVCEAMCSLVMRISVAIEKRQDNHPALTGINRGLRRGIHNPYRDTGEHFAKAAALTEQIMTRWPGRWPNSI